MKTYGKALFSKDDFTLVEVCETDGTGRKIIVGYAILNPEGEEIASYSNYDDALTEFNRISDDGPPPPGYGM